VPDEAAERRWKARIPLRRFGVHQELADLAAYLLADGSAFINGEVVTIDGGEWLHGAGEFNHLGELSEAQWAEMRAR
jgi:NAD(P)-dependent dehydrogenase (short-subunit alcohol dehydrogenase family)